MVPSTWKILTFHGFGIKWKEKKVKTLSTDEAPQWETVPSCHI